MSARTWAIALLSTVCLFGCNSSSVPELTTHYDGAGPVRVRSTGDTHIAVLGDHRFVVSKGVIRSNGAVVARYPDGSGVITIRKTESGAISILADDEELFADQ